MVKMLLHVVIWQIHIFIIIILIILLKCNMIIMRDDVYFFSFAYCIWMMMLLFSSSCSSFLVGKAELVVWSLCSPHDHGSCLLTIFANESNTGLSAKGRPWRSNVRCTHRFNAAKVVSRQRIDLRWIHPQASA